MVDIVTAFHAHRSDGILFARLGNLSRAIGCGCGQAVIGQGLEGHAVNQSDADRQRGAGTDTVPLKQAG
ncbi:MAG: hypothetical protein RI928_2326 [Pseudomonadota bacterium]